MSISITVEEALRRTIDANLYFLPCPTDESDEPRQNFCIALGLPFTRSDDKWEFRVLMVYASCVEKNGNWGDDERTGWGIERVAISPNTLEFVGDEVALKIQLISRCGSVGAVATAFLDRWPIVDNNEFPGDLFTLFTDRNMAWSDLQQPIMTHEYC